MAWSFEEVIEKTGADVVGGQLIVGILENRKMIGFMENGAFTITEEGKEYLAALDKPKATRKKKEVEITPVPDEEVVLDDNFKLD
jgi:hypothetical protein